LQVSPTRPPARGPVPGTAAIDSSTWSEPISTVPGTVSRCEVERRTMTTRSHQSLRLAAAALCLLFAWQASAAELKHLFGVRMPMRDGVELSADIWMPSDEGRYPAILIRTPYVKTNQRHRFPEYGAYFASHGYAFVVQDVRGRGDSDGDFDFFFGEGEDGFDTIEWIATQSWSNGRVGMMGASYWGTVQWLAAREKPPHLACIVPTAPAGRYFDEVPYNGGAFMLGWALPYLNDISGQIAQSINAAEGDWEELLQHRPLEDLDELMGREMRLYQEFLEHPTLDAYWKRISFTAEDFRNLDLPALTVTGWFDGDQPGALFYWRGMAEHSRARDSQFLLIGPWTHSQTYLGGELKLNDMEFAPESVVDTKALHLAFFNRYLEGSSTDFDHPRARVYVTGSNRWRELAEYPPAEAGYRRLYLHSSGRANTLIGDGSLSWEAPEEEAPDRYSYDPKNPVPSSVGDEELAIDRRAIERRDDVLVYTTEVLEEPLEVIGTVFVRLHAASDALDTDFTANILDVYPDGRAVKLANKAAGVIRARFRNGYASEELITPGKAEEYTIELGDIGHSFLEGHRIRRFP
jgi:putative CocE/NonD family hydrolase